MMISISSVTKKILAISFLVTIVVSGLATMVFVELSDRTALYQENLRLVEEGAERQKDVDRVQRIIQESVEERNKLSNYSLSITEAANFLEMMEQYANSNNFDLTIGQLEVVADERVQVEMLNIPYQLEGAEQSILDFLLLLESLPYFSYIESFSMSTNERLAPTFSATLNLRVKYDES